MGPEWGVEHSQWFSVFGPTAQSGYKCHSWPAAFKALAGFLLVSPVQVRASRCGADVAKTHQETGAAFYCSFADPDPK